MRHIVLFLVLAVAVAAVPARATGQWVGTPAPTLRLPDQDGQLRALAEFRGQWVALYFYPKDDTPGCTAEALEFSELEGDFARLGASVLGVSRDDCIRHGEFRDKHGISVQLLADKEGEACQAYGVWQEKEKDGVKRMGIVRSTFVIDKKGIIRHALYGVQSKGHAEEVLELIKEMK
jgi:peroxiredoxin Q/BCP